MFKVNGGIKSKNSLRKRTLSRNNSHRRKHTEQNACSFEYTECRSWCSKRRNRPFAYSNDVDRDLSVDLSRSKYLGNDRRSGESHSERTSAFVVTGAPIAIVSAPLAGKWQSPITIQRRRRDDNGRVALCKSDPSRGNSEFLFSLPPYRWKKLQPEN